MTLTNIREGMTQVQHFSRFVCCLVAPLLIACGGPEIRNLRVIESAYDAQQMATRVRLSFEVWDGREQLPDINADSFTVYEDGQEASNESLTDSQTETVPVPVVLVLDTSYSMYLANAIKPLKVAAEMFRDRLKEKGLEVKIYRFANTMSLVHTAYDIPNEFAGERFTALYAAVGTVFDEEPGAVYVVLSDGADNFSQNAGIHFETLYPRVSGEGVQRVVHVVAFGKIEGEKDRDGRDAYDVLQQLAENGSYREENDPDAFSTAFDDIASRIRKPYLFDYLSPSLVGGHQLELELSHPRGDDRKGPVEFLASRLPVPSSVSLEAPTAAAVDDFSLPEILGGAPPEVVATCQQALAMESVCKIPDVKPLKMRFSEIMALPVQARVPFAKFHCKVVLTLMERDCAEAVN